MPVVAARALIAGNGLWFCSLFAAAGGALIFVAMRYLE